MNLGRRKRATGGRTVWQPAAAKVRDLILAAILERNPIPIAYRVNYLANFYIGPLVRELEKSFGMSRPEWIVLFCLQQQEGLNAQQISHVTGRPKTSISAAIKLLQKKKLISRETDVQDGRRQVLQVTDAGQRVYARILEKFVVRENQMVSCLSAHERAAFHDLLQKMLDNSADWAKDY
jgi:DNA-binding MarR family transcriptional regulator